MSTRARASMRAVLLHNSGVIIEGHTFYGTPYNVRHEHTPHDGFQLEDEAALRTIYARIPPATAVLITHCFVHVDVEQAFITLKT